eukprot:gb/GECG01014833.1/.p1 GENE.gb/GECG01014833.1/~~gb/GECG01014833.1/.p1  ORF type:complete len:108 (+),score=5.77 gb/GECG01014833.1/:1-324(+)
MPSRSSSRSPASTRSRMPSSRQRRPTPKVVEQQMNDNSKPTSTKRSTSESTGWQVFSSNAEIKWTEKFFIMWAFCGWIPMMAIVIATSAYEVCRLILYEETCSDYLV